MKGLFYNLTFFIPVVICAQQNWHKSSTMDYIWQNVGNEAFSDGEALYTSLAFSPIGEPYVAFKDWGNSMKATVMKFNGTSWVNVGNAGFSAADADYTSIAFSPTGEPYIAYVDYIKSFKSTVKKFNGTSWVNVGVSGFSGGEVENTTIAFSLSGEPYVAYMDKGNFWRATVMNYTFPAVINELQHSQIYIYPNPATVTMTINFNRTSGKTICIEITDIRGKKMFERQFYENKITFNVENYTAGMYFVKLRTENLNYITKFFKN